MNDLRNTETSLLAAELCTRIVQHDRSANGVVVGILALLTKLAVYLREEERFVLGEGLRDAADLLERQCERAKV